MNFSTFRNMLPSKFPIEFSTPLGGAAWAVLLGIPVGIIALYFLKLRRRAVQVPSTLLWRRSLEDLHVNSLFQRLRRNLLLFLQLMAIFLAMLALLAPRMSGTTGQGQRYVLTIDNSASMGSTDVSPTRLARAKAEAKKVVDAMGGDDLAMVIAFSDRAHIVSNYTGDRRLLNQRIDDLTLSESTTSLRDALQLAAGLANPSKYREGEVASTVVTPKMLIYTDGGFPDVEGFSLGNLEPEVVVIGPPPIQAPAPTPGAVEEGPKSRIAPSDNVSILALQTRRSDDKPDLYQVFGRVHNFRAEPVETEAKLLRRDPENPAGEGKLIDAIALKIAPQNEQSFKFDFPSVGLTELEVRIDVTDAQPLDNKAFAVIGNPRKAQVLAITPGNRYLVDTLQTPMAVERADVVVITPDQAKIDPFARDMKSGRYDLVIYDQFRPETAPEANTLYFGVLPPGPAYEKSRPVENPVVLDWDVSHPLMQFVRDLSTIVVLKAIAIEPPQGATTLIESNKGPLAFVISREGYTDAVVTFPLMDGDKFNTTWFKNISFPLFLFNSIQVLGNSREAAGEDVHLPGRNVVLRVESFDGPLKVTGPDGKLAETLTRSPQGTYVFGKADATGIYHARWGKEGLMPFVVNQFDFRESDIAPRGLVPEGTPKDKEDAFKIKIGYNPVASTKALQPVKKDKWWWIAVAALGIVLLEWYIYNRRVFV